MIKKIKDKLLGLIESKVDVIVKKQLFLQQINFNNNQLLQLFKGETFVPLTTWSISPSALLHVLNDITINNRKGVMEFGAGVSTLYIAKLIKTLDLDTTFFSVESDERWAEEVERQLKSLELNKVVKIIHSPIVTVAEQLKFREQTTWYDTDIIKDFIGEEIKFDLILVDGPKGASTPFARYTAVPFLQPMMKDRFSIYLDDINRAEEKEIALQWQQLCNSKVTFRESYAVITNSNNFDVTPFQLG